MNSYVTGAMIKRLREDRNMTQAQLAQKLGVSDKAVSKWETGKGYPDISLVEPIASALGVSVVELMAGNEVTNRNRGFNMRRAKFYVCPVCGNVIVGAGEAVICCCGVTLIPCEAEPSDEEHEITLEPVEDEYFVSLDHAMSKEHFISFIAGVYNSGISIIKLYPEGGAQARLKKAGLYSVYAFCNRHGLFTKKVR